MARAMSVERRIAMTGTPTKNSTCSEALKNIHGLLGFLQHEYGANPTQWRKDITQPFGQRDPRALERLSALLGLPNGLMIRHRKADVPGLEDPIRRTVY
eukprot:CAMPEP_0119486038 /NCGR_PEP_ID=MMETSP1344-20130328/12557_1 /TAXON_ID=236787 /ORGANISM="Florenciella parvula, Strain CCMP2471" /LENGTH=98 /DNA_ID=CAMNT_0007520753 /DNA_START=71 /DNA_END=364 /DNA_ORIENTATION=+